MAAGALTKRSWPYMVLIVVEDGRELFGGQAPREVLRRDVGVKMKFLDLSSARRPLNTAASSKMRWCQRWKARLFSW